MATTLFQAPCACVGACSVVGLFATPGTGLLRWHIGKESACSAGVLGLIPGLERFLGGGNGNPLQYICLENPMDRGAWLATVHGVAKNWR